jgi:uncharacterized protein YcbX
MADGSIALLARYPVKSMLGETVEAFDVGTEGVVGDRAYAVVDRSDGLVASAKNPRKWGGLLHCRASFLDAPAAGAPVLIELPDGTNVRSDAADVDAALSAYTGRDVTLASVAPADRRFEEVWPDIEGLAPAEIIETTNVGRSEDGEPISELALGMAAPAGTFFDLSVLHVLTTATLAALAAAAPDATFDWRRYRPNVLIDTEADGYVENAWAGRSLTLGGATATVSIPAMRCVMTTLAQPDLPQDRGTLKAIATHNRIEIPGLGLWACAGAYADVASPGRVAVGDPVTVG